MRRLLLVVSAVLVGMLLARALDAAVVLPIVRALST